MVRTRVKLIFWCSLVLLLLFNKEAYTQNKIPIEHRISDDICKCFGEYGFEVADKRINQAMDTCTNKIVKKYNAELEIYFEASKNADYNTGYKAGKIFFREKIAPLLFKNCEALKKLANPKEY